MTTWRNMVNEAGSPWRLAGWVLLFLFPITALVVDKAASTIFTVFALAGLYLLTRGRHHKPDAAVRWVLMAFAAYFLVGLLSFLLGERTELGEKLLGRDIRFLVIVAVYFAIVPLAISRKFIVYAVALGGVVTGTVATGEMLLAEHAWHRVEGETIAILFGHLAASLAVINIAFFLGEEKRKRYLAVVGVLGAAVGVVFSGTRGALFTLLLIAGILVISSIVRGKVGWKPALLLALASISILVTSQVREGVVRRAETGIAEILRFLDDRARTNSFAWPAVPTCYNDKVFLQWLIDNSLVGGEGELDIEIVEFDDAFRKAAGDRCQDAYRVKLHNQSKQAASWIYLPHRNLPPNAEDVGRLVVRGEGDVGLGAAPQETRIHVSAHLPEVISVAAPERHDTRLLFVLKSGQQLEFVPVLMFDGEYKFLPAITSFGSRVFMWLAAFQAFLESPVFGHGTGAYPVVLERYAQAGRSPWQLVEFDHAHNEILTIAADRGLLGLLSLFAVYAAPFWLFWRRRDVFGLAGMAFVGSIFLSGLTETIFNHSLGITYYSVFVLILATAPREVPVAPENSKNR